ncbi:C4-dicarboxylate ABC transporter permease [Mangrovibacter phragmitis]|uniref:TRAP transporter small permease protein n=1 Tax=Mangrovibacter phragmitis TaxID=1691903 RepID=A0A1B7L577_9ENTR|nr:TRAP transporter small permease [Mangrovibacter phragmitis]OAT77564.1 C4-dicarboxylate ABC transporter permease [Mangrovibacter phragmitis]
MAVLETFKKYLDTFVAWVCIGIVGMMTVLITWQVITRYLFNSPSAVSEILSRYLFIWLILFGSAYVFGLREHMAISFIKEKFSPRVKIITDMFTELAIAVFTFTVMIIGGWYTVLRQMWQLDSALQIPMGYIYSAIPLSGGLIVFYFLYNEIHLFRRLNTLNSVPGGEE